MNGRSKSADGLKSSTTRCLSNHRLLTTRNRCTPIDSSGIRSHLLLLRLSHAMTSGTRSCPRPRTSGGGIPPMEGMSEAVTARSQTRQAAHQKEGRYGPVDPRKGYDGVDKAALGEEVAAVANVVPVTLSRRGKRGRRGGVK